MGVYIETHIRADLDDLWARTREPARHRRWDLRLTDIHYLPRAEGEPRRFRYVAQVLPFLTTTGTGVVAGEKEGSDGTRTAALRFTSSHPLSPIAEGIGYWRCVPDAHGVRFLTGYDYRPRWGALGALADRLLLRPFLRWATAWSFDRLRLWLERGITPERALANWLTELAVRALVLTACLTGLGLESPPGPGSSLNAFGTLAPAVAYLCPLLLLAAVCVTLFKSPLDSTPAARRCDRSPVTRVCTPRVLRTLEDLG
ncbi:hypothetical protein [Streptomyces sp. L2]|uniref:hypothetical protein n=1 Tax=Streptomyces sp. L2 TaxID=2162665 RepID=UPI001011CB56|nr:hypothetical protein [Streptomyces sp. L2]